MAKYIECEQAYELASDFAGQAGTKMEYSAYWKVARAIKELPAADVVEVMHAHKGQHIGHKHYCSACGQLAYCEDYCSKCGAKMDGKGE